jgi:tetratricopeptide (TPR) repeat protein
MKITKFVLAFVLLSAPGPSALLSGAEAETGSSDLSLQDRSAPAPNGQDGSPKSETDRLNAEVVKLYNSRNYDAALPLARKVLDERQRALSPDKNQITIAEINLAEVLIGLGKWSEAISLYEKLLKDSESANGAESVMNAPLLDTLAVLQYRGGSPEKAERHYKRALALRESNTDSSVDDISRSLYNLGDFYRLSGQFKKAEPLYLRSIELLQKQNPLQRASIVKIVGSYKCLLYQSERPSEIKGLIERFRNVTDNASSSATGVILNGKALSLPKPDYPPYGRDRGISDIVVVKVNIDESGRVMDAKDICGALPVFAKAAVASAMKAKFSPTTVGGEPVKVTGEVIFRFKSR